MLRFISLTFFLIFAASSFAQELPAQIPPWKVLENGLEVYQGDLNSKFMVVRLSPKKHSTKILRAQDFGKKELSAAEVCSLSGALMCVNGSFFDERHNPLGLIVSSGIMFQKVHLGGETLNGIFFLSRKGFGVVERSNFASQLAFEALQAGPVLIQDAKNLREPSDTNLSERSALCLNQTYTPIFFVSAAGAKPASLFELADFMLKEEFGCQVALNLDGGGSSQLFLKKGRLRGQVKDGTDYEIQGHDKVPVFVGVIEGMPF